MLGIDWLHELEEMVVKGQRILACPGVVEKEWVIGKPIEELRTLAQRVADARKSEVNIVALLPHQEALPGDLFLVPTKIIDIKNTRGAPSVKWSLIDTKEAAEMMRDVKYGPAPFFCMQNAETIEPSAAAKAQRID